MHTPTPKVSTYEPPTIVDYGELVDLTAAGNGGDNLDADFKRGTPKGSLTFSS
jgi:hypothetical protein